MRYLNDVRGPGPDRIARTVAASSVGAARGRRGSRVTGHRESARSHAESADRGRSRSRGAGGVHTSLHRISYLINWRCRGSAIAYTRYSEFRVDVDRYIAVPLYSDAKGGAAIVPPVPALVSQDP